MNAVNAFLKRYQPIALALLLLLLSFPWLYRETFALSPGLWVGMAGALIMGGGWMLATAHARTRQAAYEREHPGRVDFRMTYLIPFAAAILIGLPLLLLGDRLYARVRLEIDRSQMEQFLAGGAECPTALCIRNGADLAGFAWTIHDESWSGVCYDPGGRARAAEQAADADRRAGRPHTPQVLDGAVTLTKRIGGGDWIDCTVRTRPRREDAS